MLAIFSTNSETQLHCDASSDGYGAVLMQKKEDQKFHPISYFSKRTTPSESKCHSYELECLAIVYALRRFRIYLYGRQFKIITDCNALTLTLNKKLINPKIARWSLELQEYDYSVEHRVGTRMQHVDALSRAESILVLEENSFEQTLAIVQYKDPKLESLRQELERSDSPLYELRDGLIYRKLSKTKIRFYIPEVLETQILRNSHDYLGHIGIDKVVEQINRNYWFPNIREKVKNYISNCLKCVTFSAPSGRKPGYLHSIPKNNRPFEDIHIDFYGPLEATRYKHKFILTIIDSFTKFVRVYPTISNSTKDAIKVLQDYFKTYSRPRRLISDRGSAFTSDNFKKFLTEKYVQHILNATATPRANGQVERVHRSLTPMLAKLVDKNRNVQWIDVLEQVEYAFNNTINRSTGDTPSRLLYGVDQKGLIQDNLAKFLNENIELNSHDLSLDERRENAVKAIAKNQNYNEIYYNKKRKPPHVYKVNDLVVIQNVDTTVGVNKKLIPLYRGPYRVSAVLPNDRYCVEDLDGFQITNKPFKGVTDVEKMKPYIQIGV